MKIRYLWGEGNSDTKKSKRRLSVTGFIFGQLVWLHLSGWLLRWRKSLSFDYFNRSICSPHRLYIWLASSSWAKFGATNEEYNSGPSTKAFCVVQATRSRERSTILQSKSKSGSWLKSFSFAVRQGACLSNGKKAIWIKLLVLASLSAGMETHCACATVVSRSCAHVEDCWLWGLTFMGH